MEASIMHGAHDGFPVLQLILPLVMLQITLPVSMFPFQSSPLVTLAIPIAMMANAVPLISTQPGYSSYFRTTPYNKHPDPKH